VEGKFCELLRLYEILDPDFLAEADALLYLRSDIDTKPGHLYTVVLWPPGIQHQLRFLPG
jgi:hypothetical protein